MSHEVELQAVPLDWDLLQEFLSGEVHADFVQTLFCQFNYVRRGFRGEVWFSKQDDQKYIAVCKRGLKLLGEYPHLIGANCSLPSSYAFLIYGLELVAKTSRQKELATSAVLGSQRMTSTADSTQGFPLNWSTPDQVAELTDFVERFENDHLIESVKAAGAPEQALYKQFQFTANPDWEQFVGAMFGRLKRFYRAANSSQLAAIALRD